MEERGCYNCRYEHEDMNGPHCKDCVRNAVDNWEGITRAEYIRNLGDQDLTETIQGICIKFASGELPADLGAWLQEPWQEED